MTPRKMKRVALNGSRKKFRRDLKADINFELSGDKDKIRQAEKERDLMAVKYAEWERDFRGRPKTPEQCVDALNELCAIVDQTITASPSMKKATLDIVFGKITTIAQLDNIAKSTTVKVMANCVCGRLHTPPDEIPLRIFLYRAFDLECEFCGMKIEGKDCKMVRSIPKKMRKNEL